MNIQEPFRISNIDLNRIVYPKTKVGQNKKIILTKYNDKGKLKNFVFQTPTLLNISRAHIQSNYSEIEVGLVGKEEGKVDRFINFLNDLENKIKTDARLNASSWFNMTSSGGVINFQKIIRESDDISNGTIKLKIINNNNFETLLRLENSKKINVESIPGDSWCKMILECYAIWVNSNNDFGIFLRPILISFTPKEREIYNYKFAEDSEEEPEFEVPDTEVNHNIFLKMDSNSKTTDGGSYSTSVLELDKKLLDNVNDDNNDSDSDSDSDSNSISNTGRNEELQEINLDNVYNSESSSENNSELNLDNDAETSDD